MNLNKIKKLVYRYLADNNEYISLMFSDYLEEFGERRAYFQKMAKLLELNILYRVFRRKSFDESLAKMTFPEYVVNRRANWLRFAEELSKAEVVSFDVFDTLVFRAVEKPYDVFRILETYWNIMGFAGYRKDAEKRARANKEDVTIVDIYEVLHRDLGIDIDEGVRREFETEKAVCYANPYMKKVFDYIKNKGKKIILVSDMYLPADMIREIVLSCGYETNDEIFVSCDVGLSKAKGELQKYISNSLGEKVTVAHVGDNISSDIKKSRMVGWRAYYYKNVQQLGKKYRRHEMRSLASSLYKGLVNGKLHSGVYEEDGYYELGYTYGGIMAVGFCQYLREFAKEKKIDKYLFVARDGFLFHELFEKYCNKVDCSYIPFSRFASYEITMEKNWKQFFKHCVYPRITYQEKVGDVLRICDFEFMRPYLVQVGINENALFTLEVYDALYNIFEENKEIILPNYDNTVSAARQYFEEIISSNKRIAVVDVGWQGTGANCIKYFLENKCRFDVTVVGVLLAADRGEKTDLCIGNKQLYSYMFSSQMNRNHLNMLNSKRSEFDFKKLIIEIFFTENKPTFIKFIRNGNGEIELIYGEKENNSAILCGIQKGIRDFVSDFIKYETKLSMPVTISGYESFIPIDELFNNKKYLLRMFGTYEINENIGIFTTKESRTFNEIVKSK